MKLKKFDDYLKKRINPQEIMEIECQAKPNLLLKYMVEKILGLMS